MKERVLTVSSLAVGCRREFPFIRLQGKWLQKLGFEVGQKVIVEEQEGQLILKAATIDEMEGNLILKPMREDD